MTVLAQTSEFGIGLQTAKGVLASEGGGAGSATNYWYRYKHLTSGFGPVEDNRISPLEIGGDVYPTGAYKAGVFGAGDVTLQPRLEDDIGWLLYAACGDVSTTNSAPEAGLRTHVFRPLTTNHSTMQWLSLRRLVPGQTNADDIGEVCLDCRVARLRIVIPQNGTVTMAASFIGRQPTFDDSPNLWTWRNTAYEDFGSVPLSVKGFFEVPNAAAKPALGCTIDIINTFTTPRDEMIIGAYYPDDFELVTRSLVVTWVYKWENATLYKAIMANAQAGVGMTGISWSPVVYDQHAHIQVESPANIAGYSNPYSLRLYAPDVHWMIDGPPQLAGGDMIRQRFTGTALEPASGVGDYFELRVVNRQTAYSWP